MPYAPRLNELGPQLIERGYSGAAKYKLAGMQALASGIEGAGQAAGTGISKGMLTAMETQELAGQVSAMQQAGYLDDESVAKFNAASLGGKRGMVGEWSTMAKMMMEEERATQADRRISRRQGSYLNQQFANQAAMEQLREAMPEQPEYDKVVLEDGTIAYVSPTGPTRMPAGPGGGPVRAQQRQDPGLGFPPVPGAAPGGAAPDAGRAPGVPAAFTPKEGQVYVQGGKRYRYTNGQYVELP